jgi:hypothetical protein
MYSKLLYRSQQRESYNQSNFRTLKVISDVVTPSYFFHIRLSLCKSRQKNINLPKLHLKVIDFWALFDPTLYVGLRLLNTNLLRGQSCFIEAILHGES